MSEIDLAILVSSALLFFLLLWSAGSWGGPANRNIYDQQRSNRRWSWVLLGGFALFVGVLGLGLDVFFLGMSIPALGLNVPSNPFPFGTRAYWDYIEMSHQAMGIPWAGLTAAGVSGMMAYFSYSNAPNAVLAAARARLPNLNDPKELQLINVVRELSIAAGMPPPKVYIVPDADLNAFATATGVGNAHVAVTQGLLAALDREELQGVMAHELSHVKNADAELMTMVVALVGAAALISDWARQVMRSNRSASSASSSGSKRGKGGGLAIVYVVWILMVILAPMVSRLMAMAVSRRREYLADASGAEITRNPVSLAKALGKIHAAHAPTEALSADSFAHLCIDDPKGSALNERQGFLSDLFSSHPPIAARIAALNEMAYLYKPAP